MRAIQSLDYLEFLRFIGISPSRDRLSVYRSFRNDLSPAARAYWDSNLGTLDRGVIYQGGWEKYFRKLSFLVRKTRPLLLKRLFESRDIEDQAYAWDKSWNNSEWQEFVRILTSRIVWKYVFKDPGFFRFVPSSFSIPNYSLERFDFAFRNILVRESPYANLLFWGRYDPSGALPLHLQKKHYPDIKEHIHRIRIVTRPLEDHLSDSRESFSKFSLSDFSSYTGWTDYRKIWKGVVRAASNNAIVCERQYLVKRDIPAELGRWVSRDKSLEDRLQRTDDSFFFSFVIATISRENHA